MLTGRNIGFAFWLATFILGAHWASLPAHAQTLTTLHAFTNTEGSAPMAGLVQANDGKFYGSLSKGSANGAGSIFQMSADGTVTILHSFNNTDGSLPAGALIQGSDGALYGATVRGGANAYYGTLFRITTGGTLTVLHSFSGYGADGGEPYGPLYQTSDATFYGMTEYGGTNGVGTVFSLTPDGTLNTLYAFNPFGQTDGANPYGGLVLGNDGYFYGLTYGGGASGYGTAFKISSGGAETFLASFVSPNGLEPYGTLIQASDGNFYGTTYHGGANGTGTIFKLTPSGVLTTLYSFSYTDYNAAYKNADGAFPYAGLIQGSDGNFYGTATSGGTLGNGTVFRLTPAGVFTTLYSFTGGTDGGDPGGGVIWGQDGNLYGITGGGGTNGNGTAFRLTTGNPVPVVSSLSPGSVNAGGPDFTLIVKGSQFLSNSTVTWNATSLTTTYVSATQLKAVVPASLIANPGKASISVETPGGGTSNVKGLTILTTTLKLLSATLTHDSTTGSYTANFTLKNSGYLSASNASITKSTLGAASTSTALPISLESISAGATASASLTFPASAGTSGQVVSLKVSGTFTGGKFSGSLKVTLP